MMNKMSVLVIAIPLVLIAACSTSTVTDPVVTNVEDKGLVLVAGATGKTGKHVVKHLLADGYSVRALVRNEEKASKMFGDSVEIVVVDIKDAEAVKSALVGVNDVISALGSAVPTGPNSPEFVDYGGVKNLVEASVSAKVDQLVLVSSLGATKVEHPLNKVFGNVMVWKLKGEDALRASGLDYTIVRPGGLTEDAGMASKLIFAQGDTLETGRISREDVALVCVAALTEPGSRNRTFEVISEAGDAPSDWAGLFGALK